MKLRAIELEGFQSYRDKVRVDLVGLNLVAIMGPNGSGKCLPGDTRIYDPAAGESLPIEQFVRERRTSTLAFTQGRVQQAAVSDWHDVGVKPLVEVRLHDGTRMDMAATHPVLTDAGCVRAGDLTAGTWVAQASRLPASSEERLSEDEAFILGCFLGDGSMTVGATFSQGTPEVVGHLREAIERAFPGATLGHTPGSFHYWIKSNLSADDRALVTKKIAHRLSDEVLPFLPASLVPNWTKIERGDQGFSWDSLTLIENELGWDLSAEKCLLHSKRAFLEWLRARSVLGYGSWTKHVPGNLMLMPDAQVKALLTGLWITDGWIADPDGRGARTGSLSSVSRRLALDIRALHLRLGITTTLIRRPSATRAAEETYEIRVAASSWERFEESLPLIGPKAARIAEWRTRPAGPAAGRSHDQIPPSFNKGLTSRRSLTGRKGRSQKQMAAHAMSRTVFRDFGGDPAVADAETVWTQVVSVEDAGEGLCYDITVDTEEHLYIAETLIVHNSSLLNSIEFALWGKARGDGVKSVISRGAAAARVTVEFDLADATYKVSRVRTANDRHECVLSAADSTSPSGWRELSEKNPAMADPQIVRLLGMDAATARATWMISQGDFGTFCELPPAQRRAALATSFGLDRFAGLAEDAEAGRVTAQRSLDKAVHDHEGLLQQRRSLDDVNTPESRLTSTELDEQEAAAEETADRLGALLASMADTTLDATLADASRALADHDNQVAAEQRAWADTVARAKRTAETARATLNAAAADHEAAEDAAFEIGDAEQAVKEAATATERAEDAVGVAREHVALQERTLAALTAQKQTLLDRGHDIKERLTTLSVTLDKGAGVCFTCEQSLTTDQAAALVSGQESERAALLAEYNRKGEEETAAKRALDAAHSAVRTAERTLTAARRAQSDAEHALRQVNARAERAPQTEQALARAQEVFDDALAHLEDLGAPREPDVKRRDALAAAVERAQRQVNQAKASGRSRDEVRADRDAARLQQRRIWGERNRRADAAQAAEALVAPTAAASDKVDAARKDLDAYVTLRDAFRPAGIPAMILAGVVQELNDEANDVLGMLGDTLGVNVTTTKERQAGGTTDKVMVYVSTADGQVDYSTLSGSEKFRVALSLRIALSRCIARRTGTPIETIVLDEGWGALDEKYKAAVQQVLTLLSADFSVYTVSHIDDVKSSFPTVIEVSKDSGTSEVLVRAA